MADQLHQLNTYILTFNCARNLIDRTAFASQLFNGLTNRELPDLLVLSLQEIAPVSSSFLGGSSISPYLERIQDAVGDAARTFGGGGDVYTLVLCENVGMTALIILAKQHDRIYDIETAGVGVGLWEMSNKGAVGARLTYRSESASILLTFIAAHFAPFESEVKRRNQDWENTVRGLCFSSKERSIHQSSSSEEESLLSRKLREASIYDSRSYLFVAGDLNYRTSTMSPSAKDHLESFPRPGEDPSSARHPSTLLSGDQLKQERSASRTLHGLVEAPITFPPTYKYQNKGPFLTPDEDLSKWHWAKHRWPSWCDRILWLPLPQWFQKSHPDSHITIHKYSALPLFPTSDHRAVALHVSVPLVDFPEPPKEFLNSTDARVIPPFAVNKDWKGRRQAARRLEIVVGIISYSTTTWEGGVATIGTVIGVLGAVYVLKALFGG